MRRILLALLLGAVLMSSSGCMMLYHEAMHHKHGCETSAESWDAILFNVTIGAPVMLLELTIVPLVIDWVLVRKHDRDHKLGRYKKDT